METKENTNKPKKKNHEGKNMEEYIVSREHNLTNMILYI
jgi:hypothetical protein